MSARDSGRTHWMVLTCLLGLGLLMAGSAAAQVPAPPPAIPSAAEVAKLLQREPMSLQNWPIWRQRLLAWIGDRTRQTDAAYEAARQFARDQAGDQGELSGTLAKDSLAWYLLGSSYLFEGRGPENQANTLLKAEQALRRSLQLDASFARAHRNLGYALLLLGNSDQALWPEFHIKAQNEFDQARRLDPTLPVKQMEAQAAFRGKRFTEAEDLFEQALRDDPDEIRDAQGLALAIISNQRRTGSYAKPLEKWVEHFNTDGPLRCFYAVALAQDQEFRAAVKQFKEARRLGTDPKTVMLPTWWTRSKKRRRPDCSKRSSGPWPALPSLTPWSWASWPCSA